MHVERNQTAPVALAVQLPGQPQNAMKKWWDYHAHTNNQVTYSLSPFRQDHIGPFFKKLPGSMVKKVTENAFDAVLLLSVPAIMMWADSVYEDDYRRTWD